MDPVDEQQQRLQGPFTATAGQAGIVYPALEVDVVGRGDLSPHRLVVVSFRAAGVPDRVVHKLHARQGLADLFHERGHVPAPRALRHRLPGVRIDRVDELFRAIADAKVEVHVVDQQPGIALCHFRFGLRDPGSAELLVADVCRILRA